MSLADLKAELARKKQQVDTTVSKISEGRKFFRRGDLNAIQREEYLKRHQPASQREESPSGDEAKRSKKQERHFEYSNLARHEVIRRLRERREPIILFGESEEDACKRLQRLEHDAPEMLEGYRNDLKDAMDKMDQEDLEHILATTSGQAVTGPGKHDIHLEDSQKSDKNYQQLISHVKEWLGRGEFGKHCEVILEFFEYIFEQWANELNAREDEEKKTAKGRLGKATYMQTIEYVKPLFMKLRKKNVGSDILEHLVNITRYVIDRDYVHANNSYMEMAIGNAPWPVGVTASGIHKRPGNEKFWVRNVAHVLNDETQRKYIQGLKRLITRCQYYYQSDPSRCVEYNAFATEIGAERGD